MFNQVFIVYVFSQYVIDAVFTPIQHHFGLRLNLKVMKLNVVKLEFAKSRLWRLYHGLASNITKMQESHKKTAPILA